MAKTFTVCFSNPDIEKVVHGIDFGKKFGNMVP